MFDHVKFLSADEQTQRAMIAEVTQEMPCKHLVLHGWTCSKCGREDMWAKGSTDSPCPIPDPVTEDFRILAFELRDKVDKAKYTGAILRVIGCKPFSFVTPFEMICAALMAWPAKEGE